MCHTQHDGPCAPKLTRSRRGLALRRQDVMGSSDLARSAPAAVTQAGRSAAMPGEGGGGARRHLRSDDAGAGEGNRTLVCSLGSCRSAIELRPRRLFLAVDRRDGKQPAFSRWRRGPSHTRALHHGRDWKRQQTKLPLLATRLNCQYAEEQQIILAEVESGPRSIVGGMTLSNGEELIQATIDATAIKDALNLQLTVYGSSSDMTQLTKRVRTHERR